MGPKMKKSPKNAFSYYLADYVNNLREQGREISYKLAAEECGPIWKKLAYSVSSLHKPVSGQCHLLQNPAGNVDIDMCVLPATNKADINYEMTYLSQNILVSFQDLPEEEKEKYKKLAAHKKALSKDEKKNKYTCIGISYAQLEQELEELRLKNEKADNEIKSTIYNLDCELLKEHLFYIIHCNYFCKTDEGLYIPGEMAVSEFCLGDGVRRTYHTLIDPGPIPLGYAYDTKQTIEEVHGLPYPPYSEGSSDYSEIYEKILNFLEPGKLPDGRYPPLYCIENNIKASENILQLLSDSCSDGENVFRVYLLHKMFFSLKNKCVEYVEEENVGFPVLSVAENEILKDIFCFTPGISCAFHMNSEDKYHSCSLSVVQRFVFTICDHCCQHLEIDLIPGKHCRMNCDVSKNPSVAKGKAPPPKPKTPPPPEEPDFDRQSSFVDDASSFCWRRSQRGSFLHDEIESVFSSYEVSSVASSSRTLNVNPGEGIGESSVVPDDSASASTSQTLEAKETELEELKEKLMKKLILGECDLYDNEDSDSD